MARNQWLRTTTLFWHITSPARHPSTCLRSHLASTGTGLGTSCRPLSHSNRLQLEGSRQLRGNRRISMEVYIAARQKCKIIKMQVKNCRFDVVEAEQGCELTNYWYAGSITSKVTEGSRIDCLSLSLSWLRMVSTCSMLVRNTCIVSPKVKGSPALPRAVNGSCQK